MQRLPMGATTPNGDPAKMTATCPKCRRRHEVPNIRVLGKVLEYCWCPACVEADKAADKARMDRGRPAGVDQDAAWQALCPPLYQRTDPKRIPDQAATRRVLAWPYGERGLLLVGPTRTGKTRAAWLLLHALHHRGMAIRAFDCAAFGHQAIDAAKGGTLTAWAADLARVGLVFFDDLGKFPLTDRVEAELFALIERRTANLLPTVATTNLTGSGLQAIGTERAVPMVARLREFCDVIEFTLKQK